MATQAVLDAYLQAISETDTVLGRMLREPDPKRGVEHTPREIAQQPLLWRHTARQMKGHAPALLDFLARAGMYEGACRPHVVLTGAGTSDYVGLATGDLLRGHFATACSNWPTTRIIATPDAFFTRGQRYLVLHFGRSGNSPESKAVLQLGLKHHPDTVRHLVITCNEEGELAQVARAHPDQVYLVVLDDACNDRALAMTSSFTNMVVAAQSLAHLRAMDAFVDLVDRIAAAGEYLVETYADAIHELADPAIGRAFYVGNADLLGAAYESALKVQELTAGQVIAKGEDTLAFRHGPISAVDGDGLIAFFLSADPYTRRYETDVLHQYRASFRELGVRMVVVTDRLAGDEPGEGVLGIAYDPAGKARIPAFYQVNVAVLFGQLLGMFSAYRRGLNVDNPSVDKALYSRTVQGVNVYEYTDGEAAVR